MTAEELDRIRLGGRNYLRPGDLVRVLPSRPGKRDGFIGRVQRIYLDAGGDVAVDIYGGPKGRASMRTLRPTKLARTTAEEPTR